MVLDTFTEFPGDGGFVAISSDSYIWSKQIEGLVSNPKIQIE